MITQEKTTYQTDWSNIDLTDNYERNLNLLEPYSFDTLLLEINCNIPNDKRTPKAIKNHAIGVLRMKYLEALEILEENLENITQHSNT